jgi:hypothetical protein
MEEPKQLENDAIERSRSNSLLGLASLKTDAVEWGNALNAAGWAAIEKWQSMDVQIPPHLWNNMKAGIRTAILKYIEAHETGKA